MLVEEVLTVAVEEAPPTSRANARTKKRRASRKKAKQSKANIYWAKLREIRHQAHLVFDPLWEGPDAPMTRNQAYIWLAQTLNLPKELTHIGMFSESQCLTVIAAVANRELLEQLNAPVKWSKVQERRESKRVKRPHEVLYAKEAQLLAPVLRCMEKE